MRKTLVYGVMLFLLVGVVNSQPSVCNRYSCGNYSITFLGVTATNGDYNWTYRVCQTDDPAISHWVLEACICSDYLEETNPIEACMEARVLKGYGSSLSGTTISYGTDPHTSLTGFKFEDWTGDFPNSCQTFWIMTGNNNQEDTQAGLKADNCDPECFYTVKGPAHDSITVPEAITAILAITLLIPASIYMIRKKKDRVGRI